MRDADKLHQASSQLDAFGVTVCSSLEIHSTFSDPGRKTASRCFVAFERPIEAWLVSPANEGKR